MEIGQWENFGWVEPIALAVESANFARVILHMNPLFGFLEDFICCK